MNGPVQVAILGAAGYGAGELLRLLVGHDGVRVTTLTSTSAAGAAVGDVHPHLRGFYDEVVIEERLDVARLAQEGPAVVFSALPHGVSAGALDELIRAAADLGASDRLRLIDLSGDLRLKDVRIHARHYPETAALESLRASFVYGLPELGAGAIRSASRIANPGCLATAAILAAAPLVVPPGFRGKVVIDAKTGSSGSGRTLKETTHHPTRHADFRAYKPLAHQHEPEIVQAWGDPRGERITLSFVPQSMATARGIYVTAHLTLPDESDTDSVTARYKSFYATAPFIRVRSEPPALQNVVGSNFCDVSVVCRGREMLAMAALDNLVKGMAGAAIQNMNLMCGFDQRRGLWFPSFRPA